MEIIANTKKLNVNIQYFYSVPESYDNDFYSRPHLLPTILLLLFKVFEGFCLDEILTKPFKGLL